MKERTLIFDEDGLRQFAANLKSMRKHKSVTQESLSDKSGLTLSQIARIETVRTNPTLSTIFAICRALDIPPKELFDGIKL